MPGVVLDGVAARARWHESHESYRHYSSAGELLGVGGREGERVYVHVKVSAWHAERGSMQAWYYPTERTLVLWEVVIPTGERDASRDTVLAAAWQWFEQELQRQFPSAERIVTPGWEPKFPDSWQPFLAERGYQAAEGRSWARMVFG